MTAYQDDFSRKELENLETLHERLDWLRSDEAHSQPRGGAGFFPNEFKALVWAIEYIEAGAEPLTLRMVRLENQMRKFSSRLGNVEHRLNDEEEEEEIA